MKNSLPIENELSFLHNLPILYELDNSKESFESWKSRAREKLTELIGLEFYSKCNDCFEKKLEKEHETHTEIGFEFASEEGYLVPCSLLIPKKTDFEKPPVMICLQGHGTGKHISLAEPKYPIDEAKIKNGDRDFAIQCVKKGFCALAIEQRNFGEKGGNPRPVCHAPSLVALITGRSTVAGRVWDIMRAIDVLENHFSTLCNIDEIYCMGNSGGGTATLYAAALEDRIKAAISSCAFCSFEKSIGEQNHCECNYIPQIRRYFDMAEIAGMIAPKKLVIVSGETDGIFPIDGAKSEFLRLKQNYYTAASCADSCAHVIGSEGHRFYAADAWPVFDKLIANK